MEYQGVKIPAPDGWSGDVYVSPVPAVEREWHDMVRGSVREAFPAVRVSTYPFHTGARMDETGAGVKYRGRTYYIDTVFYFSNSGWESDHRTHYTRGLKNESGSSVDLNSPMRKRLWAFAEFVRDVFVADHAGWEVESQAARLRQLIRVQEREVEAAQARVDEHSASAGKLRGELAALLGE
jgi:hypothetical protein